MDVYGDKRGILADCVDELQPFIEEVLPNAEQNATAKPFCVRATF